MSENKLNAHKLIEPGTLCCASRIDNRGRLAAELLPLRGIFAAKHPHAGQNSAALAASGKKLPQQLLALFGADTADHLGNRVR